MKTNTHFIALVGMLLALLVPAAGWAATSVLEERMQLFRDGSLRGFALAALPDDGQEIYTEDDYQALAATGANVVRLPIHLRKCDGCQAYAVPEMDIRYAERVLERGARHRFRVVLVLVASTWGNESDYWENTSLKADIVNKWGLVAQRLKGFPALQGYDLINEPVVPGRRPPRNPQVMWQELATDIARELRAVDPDTPLIVESTPWAFAEAFDNMTPLAMPGIVYSFHFYTPHLFTHQGLPGYRQTLAYPGHGWDAAVLSKAMASARQFAAKNRVPMFVGEFSCVRWAPEGSCPRYLTDALALFKAQGWGWTYHCWRCYQGWDSEVPQHIPKDQQSGLLPEHRRSDNPTLLLLKEAMGTRRTQSRQ